MLVAFSVPDVAHRCASSLFCRSADLTSLPAGGQEKKHDLFGVWIIRGQKIPDIMLNVPGTELYTWTKQVWPMDEETKQKFTAYLSRDSVRGECLDCKIFK